MDTRKRRLTINTERTVGRRAVGDGELTEQDGEPLSPSARLFHQPHFNCYIISIMGSGKTIDVDAVKARLELTIARHPRFSSIPVSDETGSKKSRWIRTEVIMDNHFVIPRLNFPPETATSSSPTADQLIEEYISSLSATTLPLSRPLWEVHIINMRTTKAEAVAVLRMHHSLGDGVSIFSLILACAHKMSDPDSLPSLPLSRPRNVAESFGHCGRLWRLLEWLWLVLMYTWNTLVDMLIFVATATFLSDTETPIKGVKGVEFHQKRFVHMTLSLDDIKVIKNAFGCVSYSVLGALVPCFLWLLACWILQTINDVLLGVMSAGLSRYLNRRYGDTANMEKKEKNLPPNIRLRTTLIVNIRPALGIRDTAKMIEGDGSTMWGNLLGYIIVPIPLMMCEDPLDYIRKGIKIAERKKKSLGAIFTYTIGCLIIKILGIKAAGALCYRLHRHTTISLSNIVGPVDEIGLCGHPLVYLAPSVYGHPHAIALHFASYINKMEMVLAVDQLTVPDPYRLLEDLAESLKLIKDAVGSRSFQGVAAKLHAVLNERNGSYIVVLVEFAN